MNLDSLREQLPQFITGSLSPEASLAVSRALASSPALIAELQLALQLHDAFQEDLCDPPPFPQAVYQEAGQARSSLLPKALTNSLATLRQTGSITRSTIKMALNFIQH